MSEEPLDSVNEWRQIAIDRGLHDGMGGVEVPVRQMVTHTRHMDPRDRLGQSPTGYLLTGSGMGLYAAEA